MLLHSANGTRWNGRSRSWPQPDCSGSQLAHDARRLKQARIETGVRHSEPVFGLHAREDSDGSSFAETGDQFSTMPLLAASPWMYCRPRSYSVEELRCSSMSGTSASRRAI